LRYLLAAKLLLLLKPLALLKRLVLLQFVHLLLVQLWVVLLPQGKLCRLLPQRRLRLPVLQNLLLLLLLWLPACSTAATDNVKVAA
jgi:hypothetical protein